MGEPLYRNRYRVPSARKAGWDYRWAGVYAVTVCVQDRVCCLGEISDGRTVLSPLGKIVAEEWQRISAVHPHVSLDDWVVMPDHLHGILIFKEASGGKDPIRAGLLARSLGAVIGQFKKRTTKRIRPLRTFAWQERFYDQILLNAQALKQYRAYIRDNPHRWNHNP